MKYISFDIETTGTDPDKDQILGLSMVVEDTKNIKPLYELPHLSVLVKHPRYSGGGYALALNAWILQTLDRGKQGEMSPEGFEIVDINYLQHYITIFLDKNFGPKGYGVPYLTLAGKNIGSFDYQFLKKIPHYVDRYKHRMLDAGSVFIDWELDALPDLKTIKESVGLFSPVTHNMYEDSLDVIRALRHKYIKGYENE